LWLARGHADQLWKMLPRRRDRPFSPGSHHMYKFTCVDVHVNGRHTVVPGGGVRGTLGREDIDGSVILGSHRLGHRL
jgi:hypothetical protein